MGFQVSGQKVQTLPVCSFLGLTSCQCDKTGRALDALELTEFTFGFVLAVVQV